MPRLQHQKKKGCEKFYKELNDIYMKQGKNNKNYTCTSMMKGSILSNEVKIVFGERDHFCGKMTFDDKN